MESSLFDAAYVINLDTRADRWEKMQLTLNKVQLTAERFSAISIADLGASQPPVALKDFLHRVDGERPDAERKLLGTWACMQSHLAVIRQAKERHCQAVLILEDDCEFEPYTQRVLAEVTQQLKGVDWDLLYLGGTFKKGGEKIKSSRNLFKISRVRLTHAYIVKSTLYDRILAEAPSSGLPLDWYYSEVLSKSVQTFMVDPLITHQRAHDLSDIESVEKVKKFKLRKKIKHWLAMIRYGGFLS